MEEKELITEFFQRNFGKIYLGGTLLGKGFVWQTWDLRSLGMGHFA